MPRVSVIIPTYNRASLVKEAVESVLAQTFGDFEIIIVDDGSTDDTRSVIEAIDDNRIRYFYKANGGESSARNFGMARTAAPYIAFLDSDDLWPNNFLEVMLREMQANPDYGAAYCCRTLLFPDGRKVESYLIEYCKSGWLTENLFKKTFILPSTTCFRRGALQAFSFDESLPNAQDSDAWLRLSTQIRFLFVPDIQIIFRKKHGISPRRDFSSFNCNRIRVLERFYYRLGGTKFVPATVARRKLSHAYRCVGKNYYKKQCKTAAIFLYKRAVRYWPFDLRLYYNLVKALLLNKKRDEMPDWKIPQPLGDVVHQTY